MPERGARGCAAAACRRGPLIAAPPRSNGPLPVNSRPRLTSYRMPPLPTGDNGRCCSDHRPIMATLSWNPDFVVVAPPAPAAPEAAPGAADAAIAGANETAAAAAAQAEQAAKQAADEAARMVNAAAEKAANALSSLFKGL